MEELAKTLQMTEKERVQFLHGVQVLVKFIPFLRWIMIVLLVLQVGLVAQITLRNRIIESVRDSAERAQIAAESVESNLLRIEREQLNAPDDPNSPTSSERIAEGIEAAIQLRDAYCALNPNTCAEVTNEGATPP